MNSVPLKYSSPYSTLRFVDKANTSIKKYNQKKKLNNVPLPSASHRAIKPSSSCVFTPVSLENKRKQLKTYFSRVNSDQRMLTTKILRESQNKQEIKPDNDNSFFDRYDSKRLTFTHKLIGKVNLPRVVFNVIPQEKELETIRSPLIKPPPKPYLLKSVQAMTGALNTKNPSRKAELSRKALTTFSHFKQLKSDLPTTEKVIECLPGTSYGLPKSKIFLEACRDGHSETVNKLLKSNKWLAHVFDSTGQSGLHWSVKRGHIQIAGLLLKFGACIDTTDYVISKQVGRSPLFVAVKSNNADFVRFLIYHKANLKTITRAGTSVFDIAKNIVIQTLLTKYQKSLPLLR